MLDINATALELLPEIRAMFERLNLRGDALDDACQDAFIFLVTYCLPRFDGSSKLRTYALSGVRKRWLNTLTKRWGRHECSAERADGTSVLDGAECPQGFARFERAIEAQHIRVRMAERLTERESALLLAYQECESWGDAGRQIGVSGPTVSRLRASIKAKLAE